MEFGTFCCAFWWRTLLQPCFLLCSTNLELSYTNCYQSLTITWLLQTSPQNSLLRLALTFSSPSDSPAPLILKCFNLGTLSNVLYYAWTIKPVLQSGPFPLVWHSSMFCDVFRGDDILLLLSVNETNVRQLPTRWRHGPTLRQYAFTYTGHWLHNTVLHVSIIPGTYRSWNFMESYGI